MDIAGNYSPKKFPPK